MSLRTVVKQIIVKLTPDPFTTTSRVQQNPSLWDSFNRPPARLKEVRIPVVPDYPWIQSPTLWFDGSSTPRPGRAALRIPPIESPVLAVVVSTFVQIDGPIVLPPRPLGSRRPYQDDPKTYAANVVSTWSSFTMPPPPFTSNKRRLPYFDDPKVYATNVVSSWSHTVPLTTPAWSNKRRLPYFDDPPWFAAHPVAAFVHTDVGARPRYRSLWRAPLLDEPFFISNPAPPPPTTTAFLTGLIWIQPRLAGDIDPTPQSRGFVRIQKRLSGKPEVE